MSGFKKNRILYDYETVGEQLSLARQKQNLSFKKISKKINVNPEYLKALEEGKYKKLPEGLYRKKILDKYSRFLGLDSEKIKESFFKEKETLSPETNKTPNIKKTKAHNFIIVPKLLKNLLIAVSILICFLYLGFYLNKAISQPELIINNPAEDSLKISEKEIEIKGSTHPEAKVFINDKSILKDDKGTFSETINLKRGLNTITISAKKKYSQLKVIKKQILVQ